MYCGSLVGNIGAFSSTGLGGGGGPDGGGGSSPTTVGDCEYPDMLPASSSSPSFLIPLYLDAQVIRFWKLTPKSSKYVVKMPLSSMLNTLALCHEPVFLRIWTISSTTRSAVIGFIIGCDDAIAFLLRFCSTSSFVMEIREDYDRKRSNQFLKKGGQLHFVHQPVLSQKRLGEKSKLESAASICDFTPLI